MRVLTLVDASYNGPVNEYQGMHVVFRFISILGQLSITGMLHVCMLHVCIDFLIEMPFRLLLKTVERNMTVVTQHMHLPFLDLIYSAIILSLQIVLIFAITNKKDYDLNGWAF